jgi:hypothetical protein
VFSFHTAVQRRKKERQVLREKQQRDVLLNKKSLRPIDILDGGSDSESSQLKRGKHEWES